jgi:hypothetical protein
LIINDLRKRILAVFNFFTAPEFRAELPVPLPLVPSGQAPEDAGRFDFDLARKFDYLSTWHVRHPRRHQFGLIILRRCIPMQWYRACDFADVPRRAPQGRLAG